MASTTFSRILACQAVFTFLGITLAIRAHGQCTGVQVFTERSHDTSTPVATPVPTSGAATGTDSHEPPIPPTPSILSDSTITCQTSVGTRIPPTPAINIPSRGNGDPNGAVGAFQYVEWVNSTLSVYNKITGSLLYGPVDPRQTIWAGFAGLCGQYAGDSGDGSVLYDKLANRWIVTIPLIFSSPTAICVAVSTTADANPYGAWNRYEFSVPTGAPDFIKMGTWSDAFYVSMNTTYPNGSSETVCALERAAMLTGVIAHEQCAPLGHFVFPADLDGLIPPPAGSPEYFINSDTGTSPASHLQLWKMAIDWQNSANSSLCGPTPITVDPYISTCGDGVAQPGTSVHLVDPWAVNYRFAYRAFPDHEAFVVSQNVGTCSGACAAMRWYELRYSCGVPPCAGAPSAYQQGTYDPPTASGAASRWMGSMAMDGMGNIAMGYSMASAAIYPSLAFTGQLAGVDALNTLEKEISIFSGSASQTDSNRWGDYTSMSVDPIYDCQFWYTGEYIPVTYREARIAMFEFPQCANAVANSPVVDDTYVTNVAPTVNYGGSTGMITGRQPTTAKGGNPDVYRTLLHFDLTGLPLGVVVRSTVLWLYVSGGQNAPRLSIERLQETCAGGGNAGLPCHSNSQCPGSTCLAFTESSATWNNQPGTSVDSASLTIPLWSAPGWAPINVTSLAMDCVQNESSQCYWRISEANETDNTASSLAYFYSKENSESTVPYLAIGYQ